MPKVKRVGDRLYFLCEGCDETHCVTDKKGGWSFNGDYDNPTFSPSVLVKGGHYASNYDKEKGNCWCHGDWGFKCNLCHSFVKDGKIQYLNDCTHHLAGQTVDLMEFDDA